MTVISQPLSLCLKKNRTNQSENARKFIRSLHFWGICEIFLGEIHKINQSGRGDTENIYGSACGLY